MATWPKILRLRRTDVRDGHLLFNVAKDGSRDLDIKLIGTDQESLYRGSLKETGIKALQANNFNGDLGDWEAIVAYVLLHRRPDGLLPEILQSVEAVSAVSGTTVTITIRRNVGGVTHKLGQVKLEENVDDVDVFEWVDAAVRDADGLRSQVETLQASVTSQQEQVTRLTAELDQLVKAKNLHEEELVTKFAALLNTKKLKIRDQERLLNGGRQVEAVSTDDVSKARSLRRFEREAGGSRGSKRKAESTTVAEEGDVADEDDEVPTENDTATDDEDGEERRRQLTPEMDNEDTTVEENEESKDRTILVDVVDDSRTTKRVSARQSQSTSQRMELDQEEPPPHRRDLPTRRGKAPSQEPTPPPTSAANGDAETDVESEDEEL